VKYRLLGPVDLVDGALSGNRQRHLLALLLANAGEAVAADRIAHELWGDEQPDDPAGAVRTQISRLRRAGAAIETRPGGYALVPERDDVDADRFTRLLGDARGADPARARKLLDDALGLWRGPAFGDLADRDFALPLATRLDEQRIEACEDRVDVLLRTGETDEAVRRAEELVAEAPVRERPRALLMRALYAAGRQVEAVDAFQTYRRFLADELGLEPSPELRALERDLLDHRPPAPAGRSFAVPVTSFVGRDEAVLTVDALLDRARLVTLTGPGGVGKTRLATHVAARRAPRHRDGAVFCDLASVVDDPGVERAVAGALAASEQPGVPLVTAIVDAIRTRDTLVVLDNCEHVVDAVARLLDAIVPHSVNTRIVATSRERLAVDGEHVQPVPPLAVGGSDDPAAVRLFVDRARAVTPDFDAPSELVRQLCRRLDGLPLAIELAAALTRSLPLPDIVEGLDARFELLTGGRRSNARHRSLEATVEWSYAMLDPDERSLFDCCSVFAGVFEVEDARAVAAPGSADVTVARLLARLVDRSMVTRTANGFLLLETLRAYAAARLEESGRVDEVRSRHARHFVAMARASNPRAIDAHFGEMRAAHRWFIERADAAGALELAAALYRHGYVRMQTEVHEWAARALDASRGDTSLPGYAAACASAAVGAWQRGDLDRAEELARSIDSLYADEVLSDVALFRGDLDAAYEHATRAAARARDAGDESAELLIRANQACARAYCGRHAEAIILADTLLADAQARGGNIEQAMAYYTAGEVRLDTDPERALDYLARSRALARESGALFVLGIATVSEASLRARRGDTAQSVVLYADLVEQWWHGRVWTQQWTTMRTLVELFCEVGEHHAAAVMLAAVTHTASTPLYGSDAERLERLAEMLHAELGTEPFERAYELGAGLSAEGAVDFARTTLERLRGSLPTPSSAGERVLRTFMFTDIVASTQLVAAIGDDAWERLLGWHDRTLRRRIDEHRGEEVKHEGDGLFAVFPDAAAAIECALAIQRDLARHRRDQGFAPSIRIGLHTAHATRRADDFIGVGVHEAARIAAAAGPDEVVASEETVASVPGIRARPIGEVELKGIPGRVALVRIDATG